MVVHCKVEVLVMLCQLIEGGRQKCHRYWPDKDIDPDGNRNYGNMIDVKHLDTVQRPDYQVRTFTITCEGTSRKVTQFSFKAWPDHGCPASTAALLGFTSAVRRAVTTPEVPIVVHCSAGVGRTGTFNAVDWAIRRYIYQAAPALAASVSSNSSSSNSNNKDDVDTDGPELLALSTNTYIDLDSMIAEMRECRNSMVQTEVQYVCEKTWTPPAF